MVEKDPAGVRVANTKRQMHYCIIQKEQRANFSTHIHFSRNVYESLLDAGKHQRVQSASTILGGPPSPNSNAPDHQTFSNALRGLWAEQQRSADLRGSAAKAVATIACAQSLGVRFPHGVLVCTWPWPIVRIKLRIPAVFVLLAL